MRQRGIYAIWLALAVIVVAAAPPAMSGVSGKISGEVIDKTTGEPIVGASVLVLGSEIGTQTDVDGEFFIINLAVGKHDIRVSSIGYESITKMEVRVLVDLTTPVDFEINESTLELGQSIVVYAEDPVIQHDLTSSRVIYTADRLENLPNIVSIQSILTNYPGVVVGRDDRLHIRGGRSGQVAYYYDGFSVQDPFMAAAGIRIMPSALEELSLTSSGFSAEYGEALSGIVNAVTREGGTSYHGGVKFYEGATHRYDVNKGDWGKLDRSDNRSVTFDASGPVPGLDPKKVTFFSAGEYLTNGTSLPNNARTSYTYLTKLSIKPTARMKIKTNFTYYQREGDAYNHRDVNGISYDFNLDGLSAFKQDSYLLGVTGTYAFNEALIVNATVNRFKSYTKTAPKHLMDKHWSQWPGYEEIDGEYSGWIQDSNYLGYYDPSDLLQASGFTVGDDYDPSYFESQAIHNGLKLDVTAQLNKTHQLRAGVDAKQYETGWDSRQFYNAKPYGETYSNQPLFASAFIQDKMEYKDFIVNLGLRMDYRDADISYNITAQDSAAWQSRDTDPNYVNAETKTRVSPRLGISFPISEKSKMHFNYGFYYQFPRLDYMNTNLDGDITSGLPLLGNPDLDPEQTVSYELGLDHLIGDLFHLNVTAYYKDIEDLVTTRPAYRLLGGGSVTLFENGDYGSVKGFDVHLEKLASTSYFSGSVSYGYMIATGNGSSALEPYYTYITALTDTLAPVTEYPLDYDQRHTLTAVLDYRVPREFKGQFLGVPIPSAWGLNMVGRYGSGLPYTPTDAFGNRLGERNDARLPATYTVDMRFNKDFWLPSSGYELQFFAEVDNLFNRLNVIDVYSRTGQPDDDGSDQIAASVEEQEVVDRLDRLYDHDPLNYTPPRTVRLGLGLKF